MSRSSKNLYNVFKTLLGSRPGSVSYDEPTERYGEYLEKNSPGEETLGEQRRADISGMPVFAVAIAGDGGREELIRRTMDSLAAQTYTRWQLAEEPKEDWQFILHMWPGDTLAPDGLYQYAMAAEGRDLLYCDEDRRGEPGRERPLFKTEPDMINQLSYDMLGNGVAVSRQLYAAAGAMAGDTADDRYGYNLRCLKKAASPYHIPRVLYTCGEYRQVTAEARCHVERAAGKGYYVMNGEWQGSFRVDAAVKRPGVAVIISNRDSYQPLLRLLMSIDGAAGERKVSILIADRGSTDSRTLRYYDILKRNGAAKVYYGGDAGLPALLNSAAAEADADVAVFMENTAEVMSHNWIGELLAQTMRSGVGAAGPKIVSSDGRLLHCGTVVGMQGWRGSPYQGSDNDRRGERKRIFTDTVRRVSALSSACMMVRMETFFNVGCFDESFCFTGFDTEFCLRMAGRGYASVYTPRALVKSHAPMASIGEGEERDVLRCYDALRDTLIRGDPYYNINFDYGASSPAVTADPQPPIHLNPLYKNK